MKDLKEITLKATLLFVVFTVICGLFYTWVITGIAQTLFSHKANGSIIEVNGTKYGSSLLAQSYTDPAHMWGRIMKLDISTFTDSDGKTLLYSAPSNLSPASPEYAELISKRTALIRETNPTMADTPIPVDLVTGSGSGLDPHISVAAANYQIARLAELNSISEDKVRDIITECTTPRFLGIFGEETVNVLKVNLMLDKIL